MINLFKKIQQIAKATIEKTRKDEKDIKNGTDDKITYIFIPYGKIDVTFTDDYKYAYVLNHTLYECDEKYKKKAVILQER